MKIAYTRAEDGGVSIICAVDQKTIFRDIGANFDYENESNTDNPKELEELSKVTEEQYADLRGKMIEALLTHKLKTIESHGESATKYIEQALTRISQKGGDGAYVSVDQLYKNFIWKDVPSDAINPRVINESEIPPSREFRDAWEDQESKGIVHNLAKAKDIQLNRLREKRDSLFNKYDGLMNKANDLEDVQAQTEIKLKKQKLRDATEVLKALNPTSIEDIKAATPTLEEY